MPSAMLKHCRWHLVALKCATMNSTSYSDDVLNFIKARTLMDKTVAHKYGRPIFYKANCLMQKLAVDQAMDKRTDSISSLVFYTATKIFRGRDEFYSEFAFMNKGEVYKIFVRLTENKEPEFYISSNYVPFANGEAIWSFKKHGSYLYMGSDSAIKQLNIKTCKKYREIDNCVLDPNCGWNGISGCCEERTNDNTFLLSHENLTSISDINEITKDISKTENLLDHNEEKVGKGIPYTIPVKYKLCVRGPVTWEFKRLESADPFEKVVLDSAHKITRSHDNTLVITNITSEHEGVYIARDNLNRIVSKHTVRVMDTEQDIDREWKIQFNDWSREFNEFKKLREKCSTSCCTPGK